jgi:hypothetical protein
MSTWYKTGTVAVQNGSATVTGTGTAFIANAKVGEEFRLEGGQRGYEITAVVSDTQLTIAPTYLDATQTGQDFVLVPVRGILRATYDALTAALAAVQAHLDGALTGRFSAGDAGEPGLRNAADGASGLYWPASDQVALSTGGERRALLSSTALELDVPLTSSSARLEVDAPITLGTNSAAAVSDLAFTGNAVLGAVNSVSHTMEAGGFWRWMKDATTAEGGTAGGIEIARLDDAAFDINVPVTGTAVQSTATDTTAGALLAVGAFGLGDDAGLALTALDTSYTSGFYHGFGGAHVNASTGDNPFPSLNGAFGVLIGNSTAGGSSEYVWQAAFRFGAQHRMMIRQKGTDASGWTAWSRVYHQADILATVTQAAGVPTGGLIERGSNTNGEYVRFADGTQICTITEALGSALANGSGTRTSPYYTTSVGITFPAAFIAAPSLSYNYLISAGGIQERAFNGTTGAVTTTQASSFRALAATDSNTARDVTVYVTAVGRWF